MNQNSCKNCGVSLIGSICHQCGQKIISERWTLKKFWILFLKSAIIGVLGIIEFFGLVSGFSALALAISE